MKIESLSQLEPHIAQLSDLQRASLTDSLVSLLGTPILARYYQFIVQSPHEELFCAIHEGNVLGACTLSFAPRTLMKRFLKAHFCSICFAICARSLLSAAVRRKALALGRKSPDSPAPHDTPEVVQIFTDATQRSRGIGSSLLGEVEEHLRATGQAAYFVKTLDSADNKAIQFYQKKHFRLLGRSAFAGNPYVYFLKECDAHGT